MERKRPVGITVFSVMFFAIALYCFLAECTFRNLLEGRCKDCVLMAMNVVLGIGALRMKSWIRMTLYTYVVLMIGGITLAYYFAFFIEPDFKSFVFSRKFIVESSITLLPHIVALLYFIRPSVKEQFQLWIAQSP